MGYPKGKDIVQNIYSIAKLNNIKISDIEAAADISAGYLSRILKNENDVYLGTDVLSKIANKLDVTCDFLLQNNCDIENMRQFKVLHFLEKLLFKTENGDIEWDFLLASSLYANGHELFKKNENTNFSNYDYEYNSRFWSFLTNLSFYPTERIYFTEICKTKFYVVELEFTSSSISQKYYGYETYFINNGKCSSFCFSNPFSEMPYNDLLKRLFNRIEINSFTPRLPPDIDNIINNF